jgi:carbon storage regulator
MLVLSRRPGERIVFPDLNITVEVTSVKGNGVRVGIDAPPHVAVFREELLMPGVQHHQVSPRTDFERVPVIGMVR